MKLAIVRKGTTRVTVFSNANELYSLAESLGTSQEELDSNFYLYLERLISGQIHLDTIGDPVDDYTFDIPVPSVTSIRDFYAFEGHVMNARKRRGFQVPDEWYRMPVFYYSNTSNLFASGASVPRPSYTKELDFEGEFAFLVGKDGINIKEERAWDHVYGVTLANDWSARDVQLREYSVGLGPAKAKDFATSLGPFLVTRDEIASRIIGEKIDLDLEVIRNQRIFGSGNFKDIYWNLGQMIQWASTDSWLRKGDIIMSGTVPGCCIFEAGPDKEGWVSPGERITIRSSMIGSLDNKVS